MLPAEYRMRRAQDFADTMRHGSRESGSVVAVHLVRSSHERRPPHVGFVVSGAVGGAVVRNAVRRRLRHVMRERLGRLPGGSDVVVRARPGAAGAGSDVLAAQVDAALGRALDKATAAR